MILKGIRVIEFSQYIPGAYAGLRLAELGAEVIKIEPLAGDSTRLFGKEAGFEGVIFKANNRNKKSLTVDLKKIEGQLLVKDLIAKTDIVIENFRPGVMNNLNLSYDQVREVKGDIIYCSMSGYGQKGEKANYGSHDLNYQSLSGVLSLLTGENSKPILSKLTLADKVGGMAASERILAALIQRGRTGQGQYIDLSLLDAITSLIDTNISTYKLSGKDNVISQLEGNLISYNVYETKDKRYVSLAALEQKFWRNFCLAVKREEWLSAHQTTKTKDNLVYQEIKELFKSRTFAEWTEFSLQVDCCLTPVLEIGEIESHPFVSEKLNAYDAIVPDLGEHNEEILKILLNKSEEEIENYKQAGVIIY